MPRLPQLPLLSYGTEMTQEYRRKRMQMGDGYSVRARDGLNSKPQMWKLVWQDVYNEDAEMLREFFADLGGVDLLRWQPFNQPKSLIWSTAGFVSTPSSFGKSNCSVSLTQEFDLTGLPPVNTGLPVVTELDGVLTTTNGVHTNNPDEFYYRWFRANSTMPIFGAYSSTYELGPDDRGIELTSEVAAGNLGGEAVTRSLPFLTESPITVTNTYANSTQVYANASGFAEPLFDLQQQLQDLGV